MGTITSLLPGGVGYAPILADDDCEAVWIGFRAGQPITGVYHPSVRRQIFLPHDVARRGTRWNCAPLADKHLSDTGFARVHGLLGLGRAGEVMH
jgi:hypothetical protein